MVSGTWFLVNSLVRAYLFSGLVYQPWYESQLKDSFSCHLFYGLGPEYKFVVVSHAFAKKHVCKSLKLPQIVVIFSGGAWWLYVGLVR